MFTPLSFLIKKNCLLYSQNSALSFEGKIYSYIELSKRANQFAFYFKSKGVKKKSVVAIISNNYLERIISIIALWRLGASYLPIEPSYPLTRVNFILKDSNVNFAIIDKKNEESIFFYTKNIASIPLEDDSDKIASFPTNDLPDCSEFTDIAYIAYTSGSTGDPKGAIVTQNNIASIYHAWEAVYKLSSRDIHLQIASFGFDVCTGDIVRALGSGSQLVICPPEIVWHPEKLYELLNNNAISVAEFTPTVLRRLITYLDQAGLNLHFMRLLICGSDSWSLKEYKYFKSFLSSNARLINSYGTTEATIDSAYFELNAQGAAFDQQLSVPIGRAFPNSTIKILNEKLECCSSGVQGEIYIGGHGVSQGYLNRPNLTKKKFVALTLEDNKKHIFYKTGDLGYFLPDGNIYFSGRIDDQIKIMGYRVGLFEIENIINNYPFIQKIVVTTHSILKSEEHFLIAFIIHDSNFEINDFISFLNKNASYYSIPNFYLPVTSFPISDHGKLDRKQLSSKLIYKKNDISYYSKGKIVTILESIFNLYNLQEIEHYFFSINGNPILVDRFLKEVELHYSLKLKQKDLIAIHTIEDLKKLIEKNTHK
ncbi:MAG: amino acid adenylation domain-containing protein [Candidatus Aquirickettsiella sp.]